MAPICSKCNKVLNIKRDVAIIKGSKYSKNPIILCTKCHKKRKDEVEK